MNANITSFYANYSLPTSNGLLLQIKGIFGLLLKHAYETRGQALIKINWTLIVANDGALKPTYFLVEGFGMLNSRIIFLQEREQKGSIQ